MAVRDVVQRTTEPLTVDSLAEQLAGCGLQPGQTIIVHSALSTLGWVVGGPVAVIQALIRVVGPSGTLMMPTQTWKNLDPAGGAYQAEGIPSAWWPIIRKHLPAYDPAITPSIGMGVIAELFRTWPGARRSGHPTRSFAALGSNADVLTVEHPLTDVFGPASPLGKLYDLDGYILIIGLDHGSNTSLHLAEHLASYPGKQYVQEGSAVLVDGVRQWITYPSPNLMQDADFPVIGDTYEAEHGIPRHKVGLADVRFMKQRPLVDWAVAWMEKYRDFREDET
jgi:aminoglycoside 3-N-acetyltransferase